MKHRHDRMFQETATGPPGVHPAEETVSPVYRHIFESFPDPVLFVDTACRIMAANSAYLQACDTEKEKITGRHLQKTAGPGLWQGIRALLQTALDGRPARARIQARFQASPGVRHLAVDLIPCRNPDGTVLGTTIILRDISALVRAEEQKKLEQERLDSVLRSIPEGVYIVNQRHEIEYANPVLIREFGPVKGRKCYQYVQQRSTPCPECRSEKIFAGENDCRRVYCTTCDKEFEIHDSPLKNTLGYPVKMVFLRDITARVRMEEDLKKANNLLNSIINNTSAVISVKDIDGRYMLVNRQFRKLFTSRGQEVIGQRDRDLFPPETGRRFRENDLRVLAEERILRFEEQVCQKDGEHTYLSIKFPLANGNGSIYAVAGISTDITEQILARQALQEKNEQLHALVNASPDIICFKDSRGRWLLANNAILELFEITAIDYRGLTDSDLEEQSPFYRKAFQSCRKTDEICWQSKKVCRSDEIILRSDGSRRILDVIKVPLFHPDGERKGLVILGRDVTERVEAEEALRAEIKNREKTNITLKVLLEQYQYIGRETEKEISEQIRTLIFPYLDHLISITEEQSARELLGIISANLQLLARERTEKRPVSDKRLGLLTPRETLIVNLIQRGKSSRDIARILNISKRTVDVYRQNIRKKLDLTNNRIKLADYLRLLGPAR
ncbi:helix-turn-helix transcriptional regulator [Thermodesulfobacteriota bacterium B35]